ncbi:MAG: hypothetical protein IJV14_15345 [Lachnospiraceae bacterium]|nr:hypothetical protein [Lachnospiraceae bacterium]
MRGKSLKIFAAVLICLLAAGTCAMLLRRGRLQEYMSGSNSQKDYGEIQEIPGADQMQEPSLNQYPSLSVPTCIRKIGNDYFIADCYNNQIIYSRDLHAPLYEWKILTSDAVQPHTVASDGELILVDDTEQNRVLVFRKADHDQDGETTGGYVCTQIFSQIGTRPHFTVYDENSRSFYVLSSMTGDLYVFKRDKDLIYLDRKMMIDRLKNTYVRSFTIEGDRIWFPSGISLAGEEPVVLCCRLEDLRILEEYPVCEQYAGMIQIQPVGQEYYITVSTDLFGSQDKATMIRTKDLSELAEGTCEDIYADYFAGGGTPYYMGSIDDRWYLTEHRLPDHSLWQFRIAEGQITDVQSLLP